MDNRKLARAVVANSPSRPQSVDVGSVPLLSGRPYRDPFYLGNDARPGGTIDGPSQLVQPRDPLLPWERAGKCRTPGEKCRNSMGRGKPRPYISGCKAYFRMRAGQNLVGPEQDRKTQKEDSLCSASSLAECWQLLSLRCSA